METITSSLPESTELLRQLLAAEKKQLRYARIRFWTSLVGVLLGIAALAVLLIGMNWLGKQIVLVTDAVTETSQKVNDVADQLNAIDFESLEAVLTELGAAATDTLRVLEDGLSGLGSVMESAETAMKNISAVDIESLNRGIERLNEVLTPLSNFFGIFGG